MISFFINYKNLVIQLPVNPESINISSSMSNKTVEMSGARELNNIGFEKLKTFKINSFFPYYKGASYINTNGDFKDPSYYIELFEKIKKERSYIRLIITGKDINILATIECFEFGYEYGTDDVQYSLNLKEYIIPNIKQLQVNSNNEFEVINTINSSNNETRINTKIIPSTYITKDGDNLWLIAKNIMGNGDYWYRLYTYNNNEEIIGGNPSLLKAGLELSIPN